MTQKRPLCLWTIFFKLYTYVAFWYFVDMKRDGMLTARDILEQLFDVDSDFCGSDSGEEEGEEVYAYCG